MVDTVVIKHETPPEDPKHIEAMIAKVDAASNPAPAETPATDPAESGDRPSWLPSKFKSPEDMAKAYAELEAKQGGKATEADEAPKDPAKADETPDPSGASADEAQAELASKGLDLNEFSQEFAQTGELSADSYEKLAKAGYPKQVVDQFIDGQRARASLFESEVKAAAGGPEVFDEMAAWAATALTHEEKVAYNKAIDSGDVNQAKLAVAGLRQRFQEERPSEPKLLQGGTAASAGDVYADLSEMKADMASEKYRTSQAFRNHVAAKLGRSSIL